MYGLDHLAAEGAATHPEERGEASELDYRKLCEESLRAAHQAMSRGQYAEAHDHMAAWSEHKAKLDYNQPDPGQKDREGDDDASAMIVLAPKRMG